MVSFTFLAFLQEWHSEESEVKVSFVISFNGDRYSLELILCKVSFPKDHVASVILNIMCLLTMCVGSSRQTFSM